jgi:hypothetical protein
MQQKDFDRAIAKKLKEYQHDPYNFVLWAFPWGKAGTELEQHSVRTWQKEILVELGNDLKELPNNNYKAIRKAVASGHGIGKSCLTAWLILFCLSTKVDTKAVITSNTENQLLKKTAPEVAKWFRLMLHNHWFKMTATSIYSVSPDREKTWRADFIPYSENNPDAFAGLHNEGKRLLLLFDEASSISKIWDTAQGALTDSNTEMIWFALGNPTRAGDFKDCFTKNRKYWKTRNINSEFVEGINQDQIQEWKEQYGENSDFMKVRVYGEFPSSSDMQFISTQTIDKAVKNQPFHFPDDPLIMSVDIARGGSDYCVIRYRKGNHAHIITPEKIPGSKTRDAMQFCAHLSRKIDEHRVEHVLIDATGVGAPYGDRLRQLGYYNVINVNFASKSPDSKYANMRAYMYSKLNEWMKEGGSIENDTLLKMELEVIEYYHNARDQLILVSKDKIKKDLGMSPDNADALALSFAYSFPSNNKQSYNNNEVQKAHFDYTSY